jgi:EpsI family protein
MNSKRFIIAAVLLIVAIIASFAPPKTKYKSVSIIPALNIPLEMKEWQGKDISRQFNTKDEKYNFISEVSAHAYRSSIGENILLLILDAGNFHNPKICMGGAGYTATDLPDTEFRTPRGAFKAHTIFFEKKDEGMLIIYWISINKRLTDWAGQKFLQLFYSMFNKDKVGLMVRLDIPTTESHIQGSVSAAKEFVSELSKNMPQDQSEYLFGK